MFGELVPQGGGDNVPLLKKKLLVGRRETCDIALPFQNVSNRHCELELVGSYWLVRDLGSSNGTKVNGTRVRSKWVLPGDELAIAKHRYKIDYNVAADTPPPPPLDDEVDLGTSLLEKAGLVRRRNHSPADGPRDRPHAGNGSAAPKSTQEDEVLRWLAEDDD